MDLEAFAAVHQPEWERLDRLARTRRLTADETNEFIDLYGRVSSHLSMVQVQQPDGPYATSLSLIISRARARITGAPASWTDQISSFLTVRLPLAFYQIRWLTVILGVAFIAVSSAYAYWIVHEPDMLNSMLTKEQQEAYVSEDFVNYYSENSATAFSGLVWTNNAWIAAQEVAFGITGIWVLYILFANAQSLGVIAAMMHLHGELDTFFIYILPHGFMELTAIFIAGAAGLRIFWAWVAPGEKTRLESLAFWGRSLMTVALGLVGVLFISGLVEGFVTPSELPNPVRIGIGALVLAGYWAYTLILGSKAAKAGYSADVSVHDGGQPVRHSTKQPR